LPAYAQPGGGEGGPTYQRKSSFSGHGQDHHGDWRRREMPQFSSQVSAGSFQRPYPFHLDYYRMKWGGSYAPYFGNLYGPPNYFINGTPWYGGFNGFNSFNGFSPGGFGNGFGEFGGPGFGGRPNWGGVPYGPSAGQYGAPMALPAESEAVDESTPAN
jgi:hypothetical protein